MIDLLIVLFTGLGLAAGGLALTQHTTEIHETIKRDAE